jgi:signal transduction histidine kinase
MLARMNKLEQDHALERERAHIARDIHDEVGAHLTQIALMAELVTTPESVSRLADSARQAVDALDSVVWAANPQNDTLSDLIDYLVRFAEDFLKAAGLPC